MADGDGLQEPTNSELMRAILDLRDVVKEQVTQKVFDAWSEGNDRRHTEHERQLTAWIAESKAAHVTLDKKIDSEVDALTAEISAIKKDIADRERRDREARSQRTLTILLASLSLVVSTGMGIIALVVNGG